MAAAAGSSGAHQTKAPLVIDTMLARSHGGRPSDRKPQSASHLSDDAISLLQSSWSPLEEFRQMVLARDSEGCVLPDVAKFGPPACIYRCVFCQKLFCLGKGQIEAAHVIPHAVHDHLGKELDMPTLLCIGGSVDSLMNGVSACSPCHGRFDDGLMWVEMTDDAALCTIVVDESIRSVDPVGPLHGTLLRTPSDASFHFPGVVAWRWRKEWAQMKRQQEDEILAKERAEFELQGSQS